jgi:hypothetical protein
MTKKEKMFKEVSKMVQGIIRTKDNYFQLESILDAIKNQDIASLFFMFGAMAQAEKDGNNSVLIGKIFSFCKENFKSIL